MYYKPWSEKRLEIPKQDQKKSQFILNNWQDSWQTLYNIPNDGNSQDSILYTYVLKKSQKYTSNAIKWFEENYTQANPTKFQFMFMKKYTSKEISPEILNVNDIKIPAETEVKLLGMTIDNKLNFDKHVDKLWKSAARQLNVLYRFRGIFDIEEKEIMYKTFIL